VLHVAILENLHDGYSSARINEIHRIIDAGLETEG